MQFDQLNPIALDHLPMGMDPNDAADWQENSLAMRRTMNEFFGDPVVWVNRLAEPTRPCWAGEWIRKDQRRGPTEYFIADLERWQHRGQEAGSSVSMAELYDFLFSNEMITRCLSLADGEAFTRRGIAFYRRHLGDIKLFLFGGCVRAHGVVHVPFIYPHQGEVVKDWREVNRSFSCGPSCYVPMFKAN